MATDYSTTGMIESLKRRASIPISQTTFTEQDLIDYLDDELVSTVTPILMDVREEFFVDFVDIVIPVGADAEMEIPQNAVGERLRDVVIVDNAGGEESYTNIPRLSIEQLSNSHASGFRIEGNKILLYPKSGWQDDTIRLYYFRRPGRLVPVNEAAKINAINTNTNVVTVDAVPVAWQAGETVDVVQGRQPFGTVGKSITIVSIGGLNLSLSTTDKLVVGDYIADVGHSPIPQIPKEAHLLLLQATKVQILESLDDERNWKQAKEKYDTMIVNFYKAVTNRVDGQPKKIVSNNNIFHTGNHRLIF